MPNRRNSNDINRDTINRDHVNEILGSVQEGNKDKFKVSTLTDNPIEKDYNNNKVRRINYRDFYKYRNYREYKD